MDRSRILSPGYLFDKHTYPCSTRTALYVHPNMILPQPGARAVRMQQARALLESRSRTALEGGASAAVMIVEDDSDGGCSWCPVVTEASPEDEQASVSFWEKGEQLRKAKDWAGAVDFYNRGVVANPRNAVCWRSISEVNHGANTCCNWMSCFLYFVGPIVTYESTPSAL